MFSGPGPSRSPSPDAPLDQPSTTASTTTDAPSSGPAQSPVSPNLTITLPAHPHRGPTKIKLLAPQLTEVNRIPTKQRIAQGVFSASSSSKAPKVPSLPPGLTIPKKTNALSQLSFKKKAPSAPSPASPSLPSVSTPTLQTFTEATTAQGGFSDRQELVQSPVDAWGSGWASPPQISPDTVPAYDSRMPPPQSQPPRDPR